MSRDFPLTHDEFINIYSKVPRLCVDLVITSDAGILLTYRTKNGYENQWHLPGGTVYYRERIEEAVARVALQELGAVVEIVKFMGFMEYPDEVKEKGYGHSVSLVFLCHTDTVNFRLDENADKVEYFQELPVNTIKEQKEFLTRLELIKTHTG